VGWNDDTLAKPVGRGTNPVPALSREGGNPCLLKAFKAPAELANPPDPDLEPNKNN